MKKGFTAVELFLVIIVFTALFAITLPVVSRARNAANRNSCANNLKQYGLICKMYANESIGEKYPPNARYVDSSNWAMAGMDTATVYPEYMRDWNIMFCPSDPGIGASYIYSGNIKKGIKKALKLHADDPTEESKALLHYLMSLPVSYIYSPFYAITGSQVVETLLIAGNIGYFESTSYKKTGTYPDWTLHDVSKLDPNIVHENLLEYHARDRDIAFEDWHTTLGSQYIASSWTSTGYTPGGRVQELMSVTRILEGDTETDLVDKMANVNFLHEPRLYCYAPPPTPPPPPPQAPQSEVIIMFDAFGARNTDTNYFAPYTFNHSPAGSNVLFMDGHVEFIRFNEKTPMKVDFGPIDDAYPAAAWLPYMTAEYFGGWG